MVTPVNTSAPQQTAFANPFQQQIDDQVRQPNRDAEENRIQPQNAQASGAQETSTESNQDTQQLASASAQSGADASQASGNGERGSLLDISV